MTRLLGVPIRTLREFFKWLVALPRKLKAWLQSLSRGLRVWFAGAWLFLILVVVTYALGPDPTVHVEAITETAEFHTVPSNSRPLQWDATPFKTTACVGTEVTPREIAFGEGDTLLVQPGAVVTLQRLEGSPELRIRVTVGDAEGDHPRPPQQQSAAPCGSRLPVSWVTPSGDSRALFGRQLVLKAGFAATPGLPWSAPALVLPIDGRIVAGQEVGDGAEAMLLSGSVSIHAASVKPLVAWVLHLVQRRQTYIAEQLALQRGDRVLIPSEFADRGKGYVRVPAVGALQTAYFAPGERAVIMRAGNARVEIE